MYLLRIVYVALPCIDPDWEDHYGTDTYLPSSYSRSECLFRTRSVATDLVTSREIQPIRCAFMLCQFGQTRSGYLATFFILLSSSAASSATSKYITVPERPCRNEEPNSGNEEQNRNVPSSYLVQPRNLFKELICIPPVLECAILSYLAHLIYFHCN